MKNVSDKCRREMTAHILCSITFFFFPPQKKNRAIYEIIWKGIREREGPQMAIWRMRIAYWMPKATNTHSDF